MMMMLIRAMIRPITEDNKGVSFCVHHQRGPDAGGWALRNLKSNQTTWWRWRWRWWPQCGCPHPCPNASMVDGDDKCSPGRNYLLWKGCLCPTIKATYVPELFCLIFLQKLKCQQKHANSFCTEMSVCQSGTLCAPVNSNSQNQKITPDPTLVGRSQLKMYFPLTTQWNICQVQLLQFTNYFELSWSV